MRRKTTSVQLIYFIIISLIFTKCTTNKNVKPNVLFIAIDDLKPELGCYGNSLVQSPNIDKLASNGVLFTNHYVQVPTCGASRYSLMTGMRPTKKEQLSNNTIVNEISNKAEQKTPESFIHQLKRNGYYTIGIGKISHSADGLVYDYEQEPSTKRELPHSWNELVYDSGKWKTGWNAFFGYANGENRQGLKRQVKPYEAGDVADEGYPDGLTAELAITKLRELKKKGQPFFLGVGFFKPHLPFNAPKKYWDLYDRDKIPLPPDSFIPENTSLKSLHNSGEFNSGYRLTDEKPNLSSPISDAYAKKLIHAYYASISYIDAQVGKLINELNALQLENETIIVFWSDHGWHLGNDNVWGKHTLFENALKSPLIIKVPGLKTKNRKIKAIVETVDIYPTILSLCGVKSAHKTDGQSFVNTMIDPNISSTNNVAYSYFNNGISMRTKRYRITKYFREAQPTIELYDHSKDPLENKNVAKENAKIVAELLPKLQVGIDSFEGFDK